MEVGSSSLPGTTSDSRGGLAQLARAPALQAGTVVGFSFIGTMEKAQAQNESIMLDTITEIKSICEELRENGSGKDTYCPVEDSFPRFPHFPQVCFVRKRYGKDEQS